MFDTRYYRQSRAQRAYRRLMSVYRAALRGGRYIIETKQEAIDGYTVGFDGIAILVGRSNKPHSLPALAGLAARRQAVALMLDA